MMWTLVWTILVGVYVPSKVGWSFRASKYVAIDRSRDPSIQPTAETTTTGDPSRLFSSKFTSTSTQPSIDTNAPTDALSMATFYADSTRASSSLLSNHTGTTYSSTCPW
jgi:hypothetical protein